MGKLWAYALLHQFIWLLVILFFFFFFISLHILGNFPVLHIVTSYFCASGVKRRQEQHPSAGVQLQCSLVIVLGLVEWKIYEDWLRSVGLISPEQRS